MHSYNQTRPGFSAVFRHKRNLNIPDAQDDSDGHWYCCKSLSCPLAVRNPEWWSAQWVYVCVSLQGQGISSCTHYPSGQFQFTGVHLPLLPSVLPNRLKFSHRKRKTTKHRDLSCLAAAKRKVQETIFRRSSLASHAAGISSHLK